MLHSEVVADVFVVVVYGETQKQVMRDHDKNLLALLQLCRDQRLKLNIEKLKLRQTEVFIIAHVANSDGLRIDMAKVKEICNMPPPTDIN